MVSLFRPLRAASMICAVALTAASARPVEAQASAPVSIGVSGGVSLPTGRLGDGASTGYVIAGHLHLRPGGFRNVRFRGDVSYDAWDVTGETNATDESARVLGFIANAVYEFPAARGAMVRPYVLAGLGAYNQKVTARLGALSANADETNAGIQFGGGLTFVLSGFSTFVEAKYVNVFSTDSWNWIPISFGVRF